MNYVYILLCSDNTYYCGWTNNIIKRLSTHNSGKGAKYTKGRRPCKLVYFEKYPTKQEAMKREYEIKQLSRKEKEELIMNKQLEILEGLKHINESNETLTFKKGKSFIGVNYYESNIKNEEGNSKYYVVYSDLWGEDGKNKKGKYYWIAYKYSYTPDYTSNFKNVLEGYKILWDGSYTAKECIEVCKEREQEESNN